MDRIQHQTRAQPCSAPPRHKRALLTFLGLLAPVYFIPPALAELMPEHPFAVVTLAVASIVILMTYLIMPVLQRTFSTWLRQSG
jgi:antibiotic biosynthesis monooxygenase (ABM) superfamily enzyme